MSPAEFVFWGMSLTVVGKVLVVVAALIIHSKILQEKKIDGIVLKEYRKERWIVVIGLICIVLGYMFEVHGLGFFLP